MNKSTLIIAFSSVLLTLSPGLVWGDAQKVFAKASRSVVVVLATNKNGKNIAQGSGVALDPSIVVTNCHVINDKKNIFVRVGENEMQNAYMIRGDQDVDICFLGVKDMAATKVELNLSRPKIGDTVYAIGAPKGLALSLTRGIVSQLRAYHGTWQIQTDAAISPGSSGGGLFNEAGQLIGITTSKFTGDDVDNIGFAITVETMIDAMKKHAQKPKQSMWKRAWGWYKELAWWQTLGLWLIAVVLIHTAANSTRSKKRTAKLLDKSDKNG